MSTLSRHEVYSAAAVERLRSRMVSRPGGCVDYVGAHNDRGYGKIAMDGRDVYAHRAVMEIELGRRLSADEVVLHYCDRPPCCNPEHLHVGTLQDNVADMVAKGRACRTNLRRRLSEDTVRLIKLALLYDHSCNSIAGRFGCSERLVRHIRDGNAWRGVQVVKPELPDPFLEDE